MTRKEFQARQAKLYAAVMRQTMTLDEALRQHDKNWRAMRAARSCHIPGCFCDGDVHTPELSPSHPANSR